MTDLIIKSFGMYGLTIVISVLAACLIKLIVVVIAKSEERKQAKIDAAKAEVPVLIDGVDPRHVAAISAAVFTMLGSHRIVHIEGGKGTRNWGAEGKRQLQTSHNVHR